MPTLQMKKHESKPCTPVLPRVFLSTVSSHVADHPDGSVHCPALYSFQITLHTLLHCYHPPPFPDKGNEKPRA